MGPLQPNPDQWPPLLINPRHQPTPLDSLWTKLHNAQSRRGKTTHRLHRIDQHNLPAVFSVPNVGTIPGIQAQTSPSSQTYATSAAQDIEDKIEKHNLNLTVIQCHGISNCPTLQQSLQSRSTIESWDHSVLHDEVCTDSHPDPSEIPPRWRYGPIRLDDYPEIAQENLCPVRVAEVRGQHLTARELFVTTTHKLRHYDPETDDTSPDGKRLDVTFDEFHHLKSFFALQPYEIDAEGALKLQEAGHSPPWSSFLTPDDVPDRGAELIELFFNSVLQPALDFVENDKQAFNVNSTLRRLRNALKREESKRQLTELRGFDQQGQGLNGFSEVFPGLSKQVHRQCFDPPFPYPRPNYESALDHVTSVRETWPDRIGVKDNHDFWATLQDAPQPITESSRYSAVGKWKLQKWVGRRSHDRVAGGTPPPVGDWEEWARFVLRVLRTEAIVVPMASRDQHGQLDSIHLVPVIGEWTERDGRTTLQPSLDVVTDFDDDADIHLLSATPPSRDILHENDLRPRTASQDNLQDPPEVTFIFETKPRGSGTWSKAKKGQRFENLLRDLDDMMVKDAIFFVRSKEERTHVEEAVEPGTDVHVNRAPESEAVELDKDKAIVFTGPPIPPIDLEYPRLYGLDVIEEENLDETYEGAKKIWKWLTVEQIVQTGYRTAEAGESSTTIVLSCPPEIVDAVETYRERWDYEGLQIQRIQPRKKKWRRAKEILDSAGLDSQPPRPIRKFADRIVDLVKKGKRLTKKDVVKEGDTLISNGNVLRWVTRRNREKAFEYAVEQGRIEWEKRKPLKIP